jgi:hypothetical protein
VFPLGLVTGPVQIGVDEGDQNVAGPLGGGQALVEVGQPPGVDQHVTLGEVGDGAVVPGIIGWVKLVIISFG